MAGINVLSVFDGCSCGAVALERAAIKVNQYYASEVDKWAQIVSAKNHPHIIRLGDVRNVFDINLPKIDLLIGGSPCQGFSFAGKQLNFDDSRSALFFEFARILEELSRINPEIEFLLENVKMKKEYQQVITDILGVEPIEINSALVSAQNRKRLYWTNISGITQPEDLRITTDDILEKTPDTGYNLTQTQVDYIKARYVRKLGFASSGIHARPKLQTLISCAKKSPAARVLVETDGLRSLTPIEFERAQTLPDNYTHGVSDTRRFEMLGNGWTVDIIAHILSFSRHAI